MSIYNEIEAKCCELSSLNSNAGMGIPYKEDPLEYITAHLQGQRNRFAKNPKAVPILNYIVVSAYEHNVFEALISQLTEDELELALKDVNRSIASHHSMQEWYAKRREKATYICHKRLRQWWGLKRALMAGSKVDMSRFYGLACSHNYSRHPHMEDVLRELVEYDDAIYRRIMYAASASASRRVLNVLFKHSKREDMAWLKDKADRYNDMRNLDTSVSSICQMMRDNPGSITSDGQTLTLTVDTSPHAGIQDQHDLYRFAALIQHGHENLLNSGYSCGLQTTEDVQVKCDLHRPSHDGYYMRYSFIRITITMPLDVEVIDSQPTSFWWALERIADASVHHYLHVDSQPTCGYLALDELGSILDMESLMEFGGYVDDEHYNEEDYDGEEE